MTYKVKITFPSHRVSCEYPARLKFDQNSLEIHHSKRTLSPSSRKSSWRTYTFNAHRGMIISLLARAFRLLAQSDNTEESWMLFFFFVLLSPFQHTFSDCGNFKVKFYIFPLLLFLFARLSCSLLLPFCFVVYFVFSAFCFVLDFSKVILTRENSKQRWELFKHLASLSRFSLGCV